MANENTRKTMEIYVEPISVHPISVVELIIQNGGRQTEILVFALCLIDLAFSNVYEDL